MSTSIDDGYAFNDATGAWQPLAPTHETPSARSVSPAVWTGSQMLIFSGFNDGDAPDELWAYTP